MSAGRAAAGLHRSDDPSWRRMPGAGQSRAFRPIKGGAGHSDICAGMGTRQERASGGAGSASARVGAAWRELGPHALAHHRAELFRDLAALRAPAESSAEPTRGWRVGPIQRQRVKLLAATY